MKEKLYLVAGAKFGDLEGHTLLVFFRHFMAYAPQGFDGMNGWWTAFETWDFAHAGANQTSGCETEANTGSTSGRMWMT